MWRIATDTPAYLAEELTGAGAEATGGRWNEPGIPMLYTSETRALACLETMVHLNAGGLPLNRYLVEITIPGDIWARAQAETAASLPVGWEADPAGMVSIRLGSAWARAGRTALLVVPSVIVPEEFNILINPAHADRARMAAVKRRRWLYDPRLGKAG